MGLISKYLKNVDGAPIGFHYYVFHFWCVTVSIVSSSNGTFIVYLLLSKYGIHWLCKLSPYTSMENAYLMDYMLTYSSGIFLVVYANYFYFYIRTNPLDIWIIIVIVYHLSCSDHLWLNYVVSVYLINIFWFLAHISGRLLSFILLFDLMDYQRSTTDGKHFLISF